MWVVQGLFSGLLCSGVVLLAVGNGRPIEPCQRTPLLHASAGKMGLADGGPCKERPSHHHGRLLLHSLGQVLTPFPSSPSSRQELCRPPPKPGLPPSWCARPERYPKHHLTGRLLRTSHPRHRNQLNSPPERHRIDDRQRNGCPILSHRLHFWNNDYTMQSKE